MAGLKLTHTNFPMLQLVHALDTPAWHRFRSWLKEVQVPYQVLSLNDWEQKKNSPTNVAAIFFDQETQEAWACRSDNQINMAAAIVPRDQKLPPSELISNFHEVLLWPCDNDEFCLRIGRIVDSIQSDKEHADRLVDRELLRSNIIGSSAALEKTLKQVQQIADFDVTVLIEGETGTGKELIARALHYLGHRRNGPFVAVNCGSIPDSLFENELFGHEKGAYTDATSRQSGLVSDADGGTLYLDEIDTLSLRAQAAMLRFLETQQFAALGTKTTRHVDVRIVAATNAGLARLVDLGRFRSDVMFRLDMLSLPIPPLREREGDALLLAEHFMKVYCEQYQLPPTTLSQSALSWISHYHWPGNVRELQNRIHKTILLDESAAFDFTDEHYKEAVECFSEAKLRAIAEFERQYLHRLLTRTNGNVTEAASYAHKERSAFGKLLKKHEIDWRTYRD